MLVMSGTLRLCYIQLDANVAGRFEIDPSDASIFKGNSIGGFKLAAGVFFVSLHIFMETTLVKYSGVQSRVNQCARTRLAHTL